MSGLTTDTKLYLPFDEATNGATTVDGALEVLDSSTGGASDHRIVQVGSGALSTAQKKFGSTSFLMDGNSDYCQVTDSPDWAFGANDFTIEESVYYNGVTDDNGAFWSQYVNSGNWIYFGRLGGLVYFYVRSGSSTVANYTFTWTPSTGQWYDLALVRNGTSVYIFIDGVEQVLTETTAISTGSLPDLAVVPSIGYDAQNSSYINGYIDELRVSTTARYTTGYTPATEQFTSDSDTVLLLHMDTQDQSGDGGSDTYHIPDFVGTAQLDTAVTKYAGDTSSLLLDGNSDYVNVADSGDWDIAGSTSQDYTVDFWLYLNVVETNILVEQYEDGNNRWVIYTSGDDLIFSVSDGGPEVIGMTRANIIDTTSKWYHICISKVTSSGPTVDWGMYVDGVQVAFTSDTNTNTFSGTLRIGGRPESSLYVDGNISHPRIQASNIFSASPNVGLTDTITVPTEAYTADSGIALPIGTMMSMGVGR